MKCLFTQIQDGGLETKMTCTSFILRIKKEVKHKLTTMSLRCSYGAVFTYFWQQLVHLKSHIICLLTTEYGEHSYRGAQIK
jgi:hypothetical protein